MARIDTLTNFLTDVASAIKEKTGKTDAITPANFDTEIESIQSGGDASIEDGLIEGTLTEYSNDRITKVKSYGFHQQLNLVSISLPNVTTIGDYAMQSCPLTSGMYFPEVTQIGQFTFYYGKFKSIDLPKLTSTGQKAFASCRSLEILYLPELVSEGSQLCASCSSLTTVCFPKITSISAMCVYNISSVKHIDFSSATSITSSFTGCSSLEMLILRSDIICTLAEGYALSSSKINSGEGYIYVPSNLVDEYKEATNWVAVSEQFIPINVDITVTVGETYTPTYEGAPSWDLTKLTSDDVATIDTSTGIVILNTKGRVLIRAFDIDGNIVHVEYLTIEEVTE